MHIKSPPISIRVTSFGVVYRYHMNDKKPETKP